VSELPYDPTRLFSVQDKVAVVTGASGAFGALAARVLAASGARLVLAAGKDTELRATADQCRQFGSEVVTLTRRPTTEADCEAIMQTGAERFGGLDILVVGSGLNDVALITDMSPERFANVINGNVTGAWLLCRSFGKRVIAQGRGGKVVLVSSARGKLGHPAGYTAYCASKAATDGLTKALGCEWGKHGITVNAIAPTVFRSPLTAWMFEDNDKARTTRNGMLARIPLGRLGEPQDLAGPLLFLASRASDFYTGHILYADGGYTAG
jgi:NAD(P)-dependent dehydrogenase (short-subunit alcohol dehydrogenase family)